MSGLPSVAMITKPRIFLSWFFITFVFSHGRIWWLVPFAPQRPVPQRDNHQNSFWTALRIRQILAPADYFLLPKAKSHLKGRLSDSISDIRDKYTKHRCKGRHLQWHPEAVWPCKPVCTVTRDLSRKLNNKSVISFTQILFIMPVLKLSRHTVYSLNTNPPVHVPISH